MNFCFSLVILFCNTRRLLIGSNMVPDLPREAMLPLLFSNDTRNLFPLTRFTSFRVVSLCSCQKVDTFIDFGQNLKQENTEKTKKFNLVVRAAIVSHI